MTEKRIIYNNDVICFPRIEDTKTGRILDAAKSEVYPPEPIHFLADIINELHERIEKLEAAQKILARSDRKLWSIVQPEPLRQEYLMDFGDAIRSFDPDIGVGETVEKPKEKE